MKLLPIVFFCVLVFSQTGCEMHPASQTVPGYAEKQAKKAEEQAKREADHEPVDPNPPRFFPSPTPASN